ncbi:18419_t:CDS:2, partial [Funneliformis geosporum]
VQRFEEKAGYWTLISTAKSSGWVPKTRKWPKGPRALSPWAEGGRQARSSPEIKVISQGRVLSPLLANLYGVEYDRRLASLGIPFLRYADNVVLGVPGPDQGGGSQLLRSAHAPLGTPLSIASPRPPPSAPGLGATLWSYGHPGLRTKGPQSLGRGGGSRSC